MLIEKLTENEKLMIDSYRKNYATDDSYSLTNSDYADVDYLLRYWEECKGQYLYRLFGEKLILKKHISYTKSYDELSMTMDRVFDRYCGGFGREQRTGYEFWNNFNNKFVYNGQFNWSNSVIHNLNELMTNDSLIDNRYTGEPFEITLPNGKIYKINKNAKVSRVLGKIADAFGLNGFEDFRICHSQVLNQKTIEGELVISIHPLDYMTMSDNTCDWESCMNWQDNGGYRRGTVEMMNSPSVIVAYIESANKFDMPPYRPENVWSNKKWRELVVVDPNMIVSVKGYPYCNNDLSRIVVDWLRELGRENLGINYGEPQSFNYHNKNALKIGNFQFDLQTSTGAMYNDFGSADCHWASCNEDMNCKELFRYNKYVDRYCYYINYSGRSECMVCGETGCDFEDESALACSNCRPYATCDYCGESMRGDEGYWVDDQLICPYCYEEHTFTCDQCGEVHFDTDWNKTTIYIVPRLTAEMAEQTKDNCVLADDDADGYMINPTCLSCYVLCDSDYCLEEWKRENLKPGCSMHKREMSGVINYYIYTDELEESGYLTRYSRDIDLWNVTYPFKFVE